MRFAPSNSTPWNSTKRTIRRPIEQLFSLSPSYKIKLGYGKIYKERSLYSLQDSSFKFKLRKSGISLLEIMVATSILIIGILALSGMFPTSAMAISGARNTYSASTLAREKLEYWLQKGYTTVVASPATLDSATVNFTDTSNGVTTTWALTYQVTHSQAVAGKIEQVDAYVSWRQKGGIGTSTYLNSVRLDSYVINGWQTP